MSNRRSILVLLSGCLLAAGFLWGLSFWRAMESAERRTRPYLSSFDPEEVTAVRVAGAATAYELVLSNGVWRLSAPFAAEAEKAAVMHLLDVVAQAPLADRLTGEDLRSLGRRPSDFGLAPARRTVTLTGSRRSEQLLLGGPTPAGNQVYAQVAGGDAIFTVAKEVLSAVWVEPSVFRRTALVRAAARDVTEIELRVPDRPLVRLVRNAGVWRLVQPAEAPADAPAVSALLDGLVSARAVRFEPVPTVQAAALARFGLDAASGTDIFSVTLRAGLAPADEIRFGAAAGTNIVYALVQDARTVACVDARLAEACRKGEETLRDVRLFAFPAAELRSVSVQTPQSGAYRLVQDLRHVWRLEAPVNAPADAAAVEELLKRIFQLRTDGRADEGVRIALMTASSNVVEAVVKASLLPGESFQNLRSKTLLEVVPGSVRRLSLRTASGVTAVAWDVARASWKLLPPEESAPEAPVRTGALNAAAVKRLLNALAQVKAIVVETLSATAADFARCGLDQPAFTLTVDLADAHHALILGGAAPGGGRYAIVGGSDTVFILSRTTVADLTASLVE